MPFSLEREMLLKKLAFNSGENFIKGAEQHQAVPPFGKGGRGGIFSPQTKGRSKRDLPLRKSGGI
jgi:hypothetical protein